MTTAPATFEATRARLEQIRERLATVRADRWSHDFRGDGEHIVVTRAVFDRDGRRAGDEAPVVLCTFGPDSSWQEAEFIREARADMDFLLDLLTDAGRTIRDLRDRMGGCVPASGDALPARNFAAEASMKCQEAGFVAFLKVHYATDDDGELSDPAIAAAVLRRALTIESRKQLNTDPDAARRWRDMRATYQAWVQS